MDQLNLQKNSGQQVLLTFLTLRQKEIIKIRTSTLDPTAGELD